MNQSDLQSSGVTADSLALDTSLQQAFGQGVGFRLQALNW